MRVWRVLLGGLVLLSAKLALAQYGYNYDANYYDDYSLYTAGYHYDMYDEDDSDLSFDPYTNKYGPPYDDYYYDMEEAEVATCKIGSDGKPNFNGTRPCDLTLSDADKSLKGLKGGLDGKYVVSSCQHGRPLYKRENSPSGEDRVIWYAAEFKDWDLANGTVPQDDDILVYGGSGGGEKQPDHVIGRWFVASEFLVNGYKLEDYTPVDLKVACADGSKDESIVKQAKKPLLKEEEWEAQYSAVWAKGAANQASGNDVNLGAVTLLVIIGLAIVFGLPYLMAKSRKGKRGKGGMLSSLFDFKKDSHTN